MIAALLLLACAPEPTKADPAPPASTTDPSTPSEPTDPTPTPTTDTGSAPAEPRIVAMLHGGGSEDDRVYARFVEAAGHGHIVTVGAKPDDDPDRDWWNGYFTSLGAASAVTINTASAADADDPSVTAVLAAADGVFLRGGDQARYLRWWTDTALHAGLRDAVARGVVIGGSSAGCAILGERAYDARVSSVGPYDALADPYDPGLTFTDGFLDLLPGVVTDTHFTERGRLGRLLVFAARWHDDGQIDPLAIGVDPRTAMFVYDDGTAEVLGEGSVTVLDWRDATASLAPGIPPDLRDIRLWQLPDGYTVDLHDLDDPVRTRPAYVTVPPTAAPLSGWTALSLDGWRLQQRRMGEWALSNLDDDPWLFFDGLLELSAGTGELPGAVVVTGLYEDYDYFENHQGGMAWALSQQPGAVVVGLDIGMGAQTSPDATLSTDPSSYALILDGRSSSHVGDPADGGWQRAALEDITVHVIGPGQTWDGTALP